MSKKSKSAGQKKSGTAGGLFDSELAGTVKESAQQIWLAGLGAFSKAQAEGGKVFDTLVKEGVSLQRKTQSATEEKLSEVASKMTNIAGDVSAKAGQQWGKLESIFEERTAKAMGKLGVPTRKELDALMARVEALSAALAKRAAAPVKSTVKRATKSAAAKPAAKTAKAAKKTAKRPARKSARAG